MSETKFNYNQASGQFDATVDYETNITPSFAQGVDKTTVIGQKIKYKYLQFRMVLSNRQGTAPGNQFITVRIILWQPRLDATAAGTPATGPLFINNGAFAYISSINPTYGRIIMDKSIVLAPTPIAHTIGLPSARVIKKKVRINNNVIFRNSNLGVPQDPKDNYMLTILTDVNAVNAYTILYAWNLRISFIDV